MHLPLPGDPLYIPLKLIFKFDARGTRFTRNNKQTVTTALMDEQETVSIWQREYSAVVKNLQGENNICYRPQRRLRHISSFTIKDC